MEAASMLFLSMLWFFSWHWERGRKRWSNLPIILIYISPSLTNVQRLIIGRNTFPIRVPRQILKKNLDLNKMSPFGNPWWCQSGHFKSSTLIIALDECNAHSWKKKERKSLGATMLIAHHDRMCVTHTKIDNCWCGHWINKSTSCVIF